MSKSNNSSSRKEAAKEVGKSIGRQFTDTLPQLAETASNAADTLEDLSKGKVIGAAANAIKTLVNGAKTVGKAVKHGWHGIKNATKVIFNDESWWNKYGIQPSINPTRPMNPIFNTNISTDPTMGSIIKVIDLALNWNGLFNSEMFNTIVVKYYERIRNTLKSNLPYDLTMVKQYLIDAIAIKIVSAQIKRNLEFRNFSPSQSPNSYKLFRKRPSSYTGYGATTLEDINYLSDDNIARTIVEWNTAVDIMSSIYLPPQINDFIDHYFGLVFTSDVDNTNSQYISTVLQSVDYYDFNSKALVNLNINNIDPSSLIEMLNGILSNYGMVIADLKHSGIALKSVVEPKYEQMVPQVYYDLSMMQALVNAYTSSSAIQGDNYIRLDTISGSKDLYTTFVMLGALQTQLNDSPLNLPLLTPICMSVKLENDSSLNWESTFIQNNSINLTELDFFAINISTDISEDVYFTYSSANTKAAVPISGTNSTESSYDDISYDFNTSQGTISPSFIIDRSNNNPKTMMVVPLFYTTRTPSASQACSAVCAAFNITRNSSASIRINYTVGDFLGLTVMSAKDYDTLYSYFSSPLDPSGAWRPFIKPSTGAPIIKPAAELPANFISATGSCTFLIGADTTSQVNINIQFTNNSITGVVNSQLAVIPAGATYKTSVITDTNLSITNMYVTSTENISAGVVTSSGYNGMSEWLVQQLDFHIPMVVVHRYTTNVDSNSETYVTGTNLLKESYIPYWYNIQDILPVAYSMMNSLLSPTFITKVINYKNSRK